ncbi:MAG: hypothetical protein N2595_04275, partial [bacterium]|nr:hypothetical protein [bacterium]
VRWWSVATTNFLTQATVTNEGAIPVYGGGYWTGVIQLVRYQPFDSFGTSNTITFRAVGASPRAEFPRSPDIVFTDIITVPEPALWGLSFLLGARYACGGCRKRSTPRLLHH